MRASSVVLTVTNGPGDPPPGAGPGLGTTFGGTALVVVPLAPTVFVPPLVDV